MMNDEWLLFAQEIGLRNPCCVPHVGSFDSRSAMPLLCVFVRLVVLVVVVAGANLAFGCLLATNNTCTQHDNNNNNNNNHHLPACTLTTRTQHRQTGLLTAAPRLFQTGVYVCGVHNNNNPCDQPTLKRRCPCNNDS